MTVLHGQIRATPAPFSLSDGKNAFALLSLLFASAPNLYLAPLFVVLFAGLALVQMLAGGRVHNSPPWIPVTFVFLIYMVLTGIVSGVGLFQILSPSAIRYDANIFYSFLPLFVLGSGRLNLDRLDHWIRASVLFGAALYLVFRVGLEQTPFTSHNAMGGYYMVLVSYLLARYFDRGGRWDLLVIIVGVLMVWISASRGSLLGVLGVMAVYGGWRLVPRLTIVGLICVPVVFFLAMHFAHEVWVANKSIYVHSISDYGEHADAVSEYAEGLGGRSSTILHRVFFIYPMALDMFYQSPIFGLGFTRFDDYPMRIVELWPGVSVNLSPYVRHTDLHAHNSYLHVLAEGGIVGLLLLSGAIAQILRAFRREPDLFMAAAFTVGSLLVASFTEHRLTTPSQAAPAFVIVGLLWAVRCTRRERASADDRLGVVA